MASEVMAVFCLATGLEDLRDRLGRMTIGYTYDKKPVTVDDLGAAGAMTMRVPLTEFCEQTTGAPVLPDQAG